MATRLKIAVVTAGGHTSAFHAGIARMHDVLQERARGSELLGAWGGIGGLENGDFRLIKREHIDPRMAGSFIGCDRKKIDIEKAKDAVSTAGINGVIIMGGDDHLGQAQLCHAAGIPAVGWPKTIDGDIGSGISIGWHTAVKKGALETRAHHFTAMTTRGVFLVGLFGRDTDWVLTGVTAYGGADLGIPGEQAYESDFIIERIGKAIYRNQTKYGIPFAVVTYSEGARISGISNTIEREPDGHGNGKLSAEGIGKALAKMIMEKIKVEARFQAHTYDLRDAKPTTIDLTLAEMAGEECVNMILAGDFGNAAVFEPNEQFFSVARRPLADAARKIFVRDTGFFDYTTLRATPAFVKAYSNIFGLPPEKDALVYPGMRPF